MPSQTEIELLEYGTVPYGQGLALQFQLRDRLIAGDVRDELAGFLVCLEHEPVVTLGKRGKSSDLVEPDTLADRGIEVFEIERGGEATYHGPGQLVLYPIVVLEDLDLGVVDLVRGLADCIANAFAEFGVTATYDPDHPGVWTREETPTRKLASVGMRVRRGTSTHGAAVNLVNDMMPFRFIVPCGMPDAPMARLAEYVDPEERDAIEPEMFRDELYADFETLTGAALIPTDRDLPEPDEWADPVSPAKTEPAADR